MMNEGDLSAVLRGKSLFVFDMDGTVYLGARVFPFAVQFIRKLRENGKKVLFFTNNASHNSSYYINKLTGMGFSPVSPELLTAGDVTAQFLLRHRNGKKVYLVGTPELTEQFQNAGIPLAREGEEAEIVVTSFDTTLTYAKLENACRLIRNGAEYLSTHPDFNCPTETGFLPDSGAVSAFVTASTGVVPVSFGKPCRAAAQMISEFTGVPFGNMVIFGDRIYTDIALGRQNGITSVLVLTGESAMKDVMAADTAAKPDFTIPSLCEADAAMFDGSLQSAL